MEVIDRRKFQESLRPLLEAVTALGKADFPMTRRAIRKAAYYIQDYWIQCASGNPIEGTNETINDPEYARSIEVLEAEDFRYVIASTDEERHRRWTQGRLERDMKKGLGSYRKEKYNKKGEPYLVVPFRHRVKDLKKVKRTRFGRKKAQSVLSMMKQVVKSEVAPNDPVSGQRVYKWGDRLKNFEQVKSRTHHKADIYSGMVKFETSTGASSSSEYMTFRVISHKNDPRAWIIPAKEGIDVTGAVATHTEREVVGMIEAGVIADFASLGAIRK